MDGSLIDPKYPTNRRKVIAKKLDNSYGDVCYMCISLVDVYSTFTHGISNATTNDYLYGRFFCICNKNMTDNA